MAISVQKQLYILALLIIGILVVSSVYYIAIIRPQELGVSLDESKASKPNVIQAYYNGGDMDGSSLNMTFDLNSNAHVTVEKLKHGLTVNFMVDPLPSDSLTSNDTSQPAVTTLAPPQDDEMCVLPRPPLATTPMPEAQPIIEDVTNEEPKPITSNDVALNLDDDVTTSPILTVPDNEVVLNIDDLKEQRKDIQQDQEIKGSLESDTEMLAESLDSEEYPRQGLVPTTLSKPDNAQDQQMKRETASQKFREPDRGVVADRNVNPIDEKHETEILQNQGIGDNVVTPDAFQSASKPEFQQQSIANSLPPTDSEPDSKTSVPTKSATAPKSDRLATLTASDEKAPEIKNTLPVASEAANPTPVSDPNKPEAAQESDKITSQPLNLASVSESVPESKTTPSFSESTNTDGVLDLNIPEPQTKTSAKSALNKKDAAPNWYPDFWKLFNW